ncbi:hypothetical protein DU43_03300 [Methanosarcina mazei]|uniref:Uncharacterized protein n=1 Tax=Methanosarcina mazei TaxID=2209 RepID=A0A0F8HR21_METMZ|nr:hypothetical protein DU43_03300 [Methanosarcina mazei]
MYHENFLFYSEVPGLVDPERGRCKDKLGKIGESFGINRTRVFMGCKRVDIFIKGNLFIQGGEQ